MNITTTCDSHSTYFAHSVHIDIEVLQIVGQGAGQNQFGGILQIALPQFELKNLVPFFEELSRHDVCDGTAALEM